MKFWHQKKCILEGIILKKKKWIASINRFRNVVDNYDETILAEEALHRLVEVYYVLGLEDESKKYAKLLGYNYQSSEWYKRSYAMFDILYKQKEKNTEKKQKKSVIKKIKSLLD